MNDDKTGAETGDRTDKNEPARPAEERNLEAAKEKTGTGSGVEQPAPEQSDRRGAGSRRAARDVRGQGHG